MKTISLIPFCLLLLISVSFYACNSGYTSGADNSGTTVDTTKHADTTAVQKSESGFVGGNEDAAFATKAAGDGMLEVQLGSIAEKNSKDTKVMAFGKMMVTDHTKAGDELKKLAADKKITLPMALTNDGQKILDSLVTKRGADFDKAYTDLMVNAHNAAIDLFRHEADNGKDSTLRTFATNTLPTLEKHLRAAKDAQKEVAGK